MSEKQYLLLCVLNAALLACGQLLFKIGSNGKQLSGINDIISLLFTPVILCALTLYACTTLLWMFLLSKIDLSKAYPIQVLAFPLVMLLSSILLKENIPFIRWIGMGIVIIGVNILMIK